MKNTEKENESAGDILVVLSAVGVLIALGSGTYISGLCETGHKSDGDLYRPLSTQDEHGLALRKMRYEMIKHRRKMVEYGPVALELACTTWLTIYSLA